jgi:signal peptidase II
MQKNSHARGVKSIGQKWGVATLILAGVATLADSVLKRIALRDFPEESALVGPGLFELAVHKNYGVAFDIPFRLPLIVALTIVVLVLLINIAIKNWKETPNISIASWFIVFGALGNLMDRVLLGFTVDYLIISHRSAVNLSDVLIVIGVVWLLFAARQTRKHEIRSSPSSHV